MIKFEKGELLELNECELGIALFNDVLYVFNIDNETVEIKPTKDKLINRIEKQFSKLIPVLMKYYSLEKVCEIVGSLMNMIGERKFKQCNADFNLRLIYDNRSNQFTHFKVGGKT